MARGVDSAAHTAAVEIGGRTVAVLAEGLSPRAMVPDGALLVSEFDPLTPWSAHRAMRRNATIAALSDVVIVVASDARGGTWEMGTLCLKSRKPLLVYDWPENVGNRRLIELGAPP